ncbi:Transport of quorum-sensing signal protein [Methanoculleus chikugoensis]|uniref:Transport of quorum-sensing signal protein n=1 Tax=Methanoculleus chikugoensis TaxID=118126 RepID=A0A1M4MIY1_9EURY|nr:AI-2E family transporter [Methanoculleus chikugoensis]SCL74889.1 Transport of quorum-sensing signal protein [Methanoculleus chikugoensis]
MNIAGNLPPPARIAIVGAAVVIVLAGVRAATPILAPLLVAVFFAMITAPVMVWLTRRRVPRILAAILVVAGLIGLFAGAIAFLGVALTGFIRSLPGYQASLEEEIAVLADYGIDPGTFTIWDYIDQGFVLQQVAGIAREVGSIAVDAFLVLVGIGFLLLEAPRLTTVLARYLGAESAPYRHLAQSGRLLIEYVIVRTKVNLITGVGTGLFLTLLGVDFAVLWGFIAFVLSYVPYIGLVVAAIPPTLLALIEFGPAGAVAVIAAVALIDAAAENLVLPRMAGRDLNLSPFVVLFSVVFWGFILGAVGIFLAIPLTIAVKLFLESWKETRWIGEIMGSGERER